MLGLLQLSIILELFFLVLAESNIIVERWVNASDVIRSLPFATMTSCYMECFQTANCATVGFEKNQEKSFKQDCTLLKTKGFGKRKHNFMPMLLSLSVIELEDEIKETKLNEVIKENEIKECVRWKRIEIIKDERKIRQSNQVTVLEKVTRQFVMHVEVKLTYYAAGQEWSNIVHLTKGGNEESSYGDRTPAIFFNKIHKVYHISSAVNGDKHFGFNLKEKYDMGIWTSFQVSQLKQNNGYNFSVMLNGKLSFSVINTQPRLFKNVTVFVSNKKYYYQPGFVRAFWLDVDQDEH